MGSEIKFRTENLHRSTRSLLQLTVCVQARCFILGFRSTFVCQKYCNKDKKITNRNLYCDIFSSRKFERGNQLMKLLSAQNKTSCLHAVSCSRLTQRVTKILQFHRQAKSNGFNCPQSIGRNISVSKLQALNSATCPHIEHQKAIVHFQCPESCVRANV